MGGLGADVAAGQEAATNAADYAAYVRSCRQELERALGVAVSSALRARPACPVDAVADALSGGELSRLRAKVAELEATSSVGLKAVSSILHPAAAPCQMPRAAPRAAPRRRDAVALGHFSAFSPIDPEPARPRRRTDEGPDGAGFGGDEEGAPRRPRVRVVVLLPDDLVGGTSRGTEGVRAAPTLAPALPPCERAGASARRVRRRYNHDSTIYTFGLPDDVSLALPVCACLLMRANGRGRAEGGAKDAWDGSDAVRPYTPISDNAMVGKFELLVKRYPDGAASEWLHGLELGSMVAFKHIKFNIKARNLLLPAPRPCRRPPACPQLMPSRARVGRRSTRSKARRSSSCSAPARASRRCTRRESRATPSARPAAASKPVEVVARRARVSSRRDRRCACHVATGAVEASRHAGR